MTKNKELEFAHIEGISYPKEKEFVLEEKRIWFKGNDGKIHYVYPDEDVKEFIMRLKAICCIYPFGCKDCGFFNDRDKECEINKLAGKTLSGVEK